MEVVEWPHNLKLFYERLLAASSSKGFASKVLGKTDKDYPIYFLDRGINSGPHILIASGFHGNEVSPPWSIVSFLENLDENLISDIDISFIPLVNPIGFELNIRENNDGLDTNRGYMLSEIRNEIKPISKEGSILKNNESLVAGSSKDGVLCTHEAPKLEKEFFVYGYEHSTNPGEFTKLFRDLEAKYFSVFPDGLTTRGLISTDGIIWQDHDGSFQDWLFRKGFTEKAIVTETPRRNPFSYRVDVNVKIIETFINYFKLTK